jgi:mRNA-degrading endonuclease RelE of RelBE toxin-antitoxin system
MYEIELTQEAIQDLKSFDKREQNIIRSGIEANLRYEPTTPTRNCKRMRYNDQAEWELRIETFRVLYNVAEQVKVVEIQRIGEKRGNRFLFRGREEEV